MLRSSATVAAAFSLVVLGICMLTLVVHIFYSFVAPKPQKLNKKNDNGRHKRRQTDGRTTDRQKPDNEED